MSLLRDQLEAVRARQQDHGPGDEALEGLTSQACNLGRAVAALSAEIRKTEEHVKEVVGRLTDAERVDMVLDFLDRLPIEHRRAIKLHLDEMGEGL